MLESILQVWRTVEADPGLTVIWLAILMATATTAAGAWLVVLDPLLGQLRLAWRQLRQRRADARVRRERLEQIRLEQALHTGDPTIPRPWPPRRPGEHAQPWRENRNGDAA